VPDFRKIRGNLNIVLNRLVRDGVIADFRTNFGDEDKSGTPLVTVTAPPGQDLAAVQSLVLNALTEVAIGIDVAVEPFSPSI
jgi:hypothetical protein